jgi:hypothetical protein
MGGTKGNDPVANTATSYSRVFPLAPTMVLD